jgi:hypothetical protein
MLLPTCAVTRSWLRGLRELLPVIEQLSGYLINEREMLELHQVAWWLGKLEMYVVYVNHLHELTAQLDQLNAETPGDNPVISLVSSLTGEENIRAGENGLAIERSYYCPASHASRICWCLGSSLVRLRRDLSNPAASSNVMPSSRIR